MHTRGASGAAACGAPAQAQLRVRLALSQCATHSPSARASSSSWRAHWLVLARAIDDGRPPGGGLRDWVGLLLVFAVRRVVVMVDLHIFGLDVATRAEHPPCRDDLLLQVRLIPVGERSSSCSFFSRAQKSCGRRRRQRRVSRARRSTTRRRTNHAQNTRARGRHDRAALACGSKRLVQRSTRTWSTSSSDTCSTCSLLTFFCSAMFDSSSDRTSCGSHARAHARRERRLHSRDASTTTDI